METSRRYSGKLSVPGCVTVTTPPTITTSTAMMAVAIRLMLSGMALEPPEPRPMGKVWDLRIEPIPGARGGRNVFVSPEGP